MGRKRTTHIFVTNEQYKQILDSGKLIIEAVGQSPALLEFLTGERQVNNEQKRTYKRA